MLFSNHDRDYLEENIDLHNSLKKLKHRQKLSLVLNAVYDMTQTEIAKVLGVTQVQVSRNLSEARDEMIGYMQIKA